MWLSDGQCVIAVEVLSPSEPARRKVDHYRRHGCSLYVEIDPAHNTVAGVDLDGDHDLDIDRIVDTLAAELGLDRSD